MFSNSKSSKLMSNSSSGGSRLLTSRLSFVRPCGALPMSPVFPSLLCVSLIQSAGRLYNTGAVPTGPIQTRAAASVTTHYTERGVTAAGYYVDKLLAVHLADYICIAGLICVVSVIPKRYHGAIMYDCVNLFFLHTSIRR